MVAVQTDTIQFIAGTTFHTRKQKKTQFTVNRLVTNKTRQAMYV